MKTLIKLDNTIIKKRILDKFEFEVTDENNNPTHGKIAIKTNNVTLLEGRVSNGIFSEEFDFSSLLSPEYDVEIAFSGNSECDAMRKTVKLNLLSDNFETVPFNDLQNASYRFVKWIDANRKLPGKIAIKKQNIQVKDFLYLLAKAATNLNENNLDGIGYVQLVTPKVSSESIKEDITLSKDDIVQISNEIIEISDSTLEAPTCIETEYGKIGFMNLLYTLATAVSNSSSTGLVSQINVRPWKKIVAK